ncbi:MAG: hypothetical protein AABZ60_17645 [Planctomycetota bacterium]
MRKSQKKKKRKSQQEFEHKNKNLQEEDDEDPLQIYRFEINGEPIKPEKPWPDEVENQLEELCENLKDKTTVKQTISRLEVLIQKYPNTAILYNYLSCAYRVDEKPEKAIPLIKLNYEKNPNYFFAKLDYSELCLKEGKLELIPEIFGGNFNLKGMYPKRDVYHISEMRGFMSLLGKYHLLTKNIYAANQCYEVLKSIDPEHREIA